MSRYLAQLRCPLLGPLKRYSSGTVPCISLTSLDLPAATAITAAQVLAWQGEGEQLAVLLVPELGYQRQQLGEGGGGGGRG